MRKLVYLGFAMDDDGAKGLLRVILETAFVVALPGLYTGLVMYFALYFKVMYNITAFITIPVALLPMIAIWAKVVHKREKKTLEGQVKGFKVSPELHQRALQDYLSLLPEKHQEHSQQEEIQQEEIQQEEIQQEEIQQEEIS